MRQSHRADEKLFVDCADDGAPLIVDRLTGQTHEARIFVAVACSCPEGVSAKLARSPAGRAANLHRLAVTWTPSPTHGEC